MLTRKDFLILASTAFLTAVGGKQIRAGQLSSKTKSDLDRLVNIPGQYGEDFNKAKIKAFHLHNQPKTSPLHESIQGLWTEVFKRTNGEIFVSVLPQDGLLPGSDPQAIRLVATGKFEIVSVAGPILDQVCPEVISIQNFLFLYQSVQDVYQIINQPIFAEILNRSLSKFNFKYLPNGTFDNGMRAVTSIEEKPIHSLDDFQGLVIRIPPSQDFLEAMKDLGANPKIFTMNEVYNVLKNRLVQAQENPLSIAKGFNLYEVTKYLNITNHGWSGYNTLFNLDFWNQLSSSAQKTISELLPIYQAQQIKKQEEYNNLLYTELTEKLGMIPTHPDCSQAPQKLINVYKSMYSKLNTEAKSLIRPLLETRTGVKIW